MTLFSEAGASISLSVRFKYSCGVHPCSRSTDGLTISEGKIHIHHPDHILDVLREQTIFLFALGGGRCLGIDRTTISFFSFSRVRSKSSRSSLEGVSGRIAFLVQRLQAIDQHGDRIQPKPIQKKKIDARRSAHVKYRKDSLKVCLSFPDEERPAKGPNNARSR